MTRNRFASLTTSALLLAAGLAHGLEVDRSKEILFEADTVERDEKTQRTIMTGNVIVKQGTLDIRASNAVFHGPLDSLERLVVEGDPATLHQALETREGELRAEAGQIEYDLVQRQLVLTGNAVVDQGNRHLTGERIRYDLAQDRVIAEGDRTEGGERVRIRIEPEAENSEQQPQR